MTAPVTIVNTNESKDHELVYLSIDEQGTPVEGILQSGENFILPIVQEDFTYTIQLTSRLRAPEPEPEPEPEASPEDPGDETPPETSTVPEPPETPEGNPLAEPEAPTE